jgi:hypothetical protein
MPVILSYVRHLITQLLLATMAVLLLTILCCSPAHTRWKPEYAQLSIELQRWFMSLRNKKNMSCCADADGYRPTDEDVTWDTHNQKYRVKIDGQWVVVDDEAKLDVPNKVGRAIVWVRPDKTIRCFLPGAEN